MSCPFWGAEDLENLDVVRPKLEYLEYLEYIIYIYIYKLLSLLNVICYLVSTLSPTPRYHTPVSWPESVSMLEPFNIHISVYWYIGTLVFENLDSLVHNVLSRTFSSR